MTTDTRGLAAPPDQDPDAGTEVVARPDGHVAVAPGGSRPALPLLLRQVLPGLVAFAILRMVQPVRDPDTFWHLAAGDRLRRT